MTASPMNFSGRPRRALQLLGGGVEEPAEHFARALRVEALAEPGGIDQVGEEHRDHLAFLGPQRGRHDGPAVGAEPRAVGERLAADRTRHARSIGGSSHAGSAPCIAPIDRQLGRARVERTSGPTGGLPQGGHSRVDRYSKARLRAGGRVVRQRPAKPRTPFDSGARLEGEFGRPVGRLAQGESASLTRKRSEVQILYRPPQNRRSEGVNELKKGTDRLVVQTTSKAATRPQN